MDIHEDMAEMVVQRALAAARRETPEINLAIMLDPSLREFFLGAAAYGAAVLLEVARERGYELMRKPAAPYGPPAEESSSASEEFPEHPE